ncbi:Zinc finger protein castor 1 [Sparganum proliferum]
MHANYHRKDAVILQEGFQRYRATEVCDVPDCPYVDERTTHFHCKRIGCNFTFKNKADIEKHKNHHQKNDEHAKNGFRKFTKYEVCRFPGCKYSSVMNHIHCIRPGCDYVVHSSSQILSHKRKHERRQMTSMMNLSSSESIYDNLLSAKSISDFRMGLTTVNTPVSGNDSPDPSQDNSSHHPPPPPPLLPLKDCEYNQIRSTANDSPCREERLGGNETSPVVCSTSPPSPVIASVLQAVSHAASACWSQWRYNRLPELQSKLRIPGDPNGPSAAIVEEASELFVKTILAEVLPSMTPFAANQSCEKVACPFRYTGTAHFHCLRADCCENQSASLRADLWEEHWLLHARQSALSRLGFMPCDAGSTCPSQHHGESAGGKEGLGHVHCRLAGDCSFAISALAFSPALGLRHWASQHDKRFAVGLEMRPEGTSFEPCKRLVMSTPRKRGRPPKNARGIRVPRPELPEELCVDESPLISVTREMFFNPPDGAGVRGGMKIYPVSGPPCPDELCQFRSHEHYHCVRPRCHTATASLFVVNSHRVEFHAQTDIEPGYEYFDRSVDCRRAACYNNRVNGHFHCVRPRCDYTFVRYSKMAQHSRKHLENDNVSSCGGGGGGGGGGSVGVGGSPLQSSGPPKTAHFTANTDMNPLGILGSAGVEFTEMPPLQLPTPATTMLPPLGAKHLPDLWTPASQSQMPSLFFLLTNFFNSQASTNVGAGVELLPQPSLPTPQERGLPPTTSSENEVASETSSPANVFPEGSVASEKMEWEEGEAEDQRTSSPTMGRQSEKLIAS